MSVSKGKNKGYFLLDIETISSQIIGKTSRLIFLVASLFLFTKVKAQTPLIINSKLTQPYCSSSPTGAIQLTASGGYAPYTFQMISPTMGAVQSGSNTFTFDGLTAATYIFKVTEANGNSQNRTIVLDGPLPVTYKLFSTSGYVYVCDSIDLIISWTPIGTLRPNYTYQIWKNTKTAVGLPDMTIDTNKINPTLRLPLTQAFNGYHYIRMTDSCGNSTGFTVSTYSFNWQTINGGCNKTNLNINYEGLKMPATFQLFSDTTSNATPIETVTQTTIKGRSITFKNLPSSGYYRVIATDACGYVVNQVRKVNLIIPSIALKSTGCNGNTLDSTLEIGITLDTITPPWTISVLNGPTTFTQNRFSGSLISPQITYPVSITSANTVAYLNNMPMGDYKIAVTDACGWTDTIPFQVTPNNVSSNNLISEVIPGCLNANTIVLKVKSCNPNPARSSVQLTDSVGKVLNSINLSNNVSLSTPNLPPGTYYANLLSTFTKKNSGNNLNVLKFLYPNNNIVEQDTIIVHPYVLPSVPNVLLAPCPNTNIVSFIPSGANGIAPYSFELLKANNDNTVLQGPQLNDTFSNLTTGNPYRIRITDICGNAVVSNNVIGTPLITSFKLNSSKGKCFSIGDSTILTADSLNGTTYTWSGPNGYSSTGRIISLDSLTRNMTGIYKVTATTAGGCTNSDSLLIVVGINAGINKSICLGDSIVLNGIPSGGNWSGESNNAIADIIGATNLGTAIVKFPTSAIGKSYYIYSMGTCADTMALTINGLPTVAQITAPSAICMGNTATLSDITPNGVWNSTNNNVVSITPNGIITGLSAGNSTISYTITDGNNCSNTVTKGIGVNPSTYSDTTISICKGKSYQFNGENYSIAGTYSAHLINSAGCDSIATLTLKLDIEKTLTPIQGDTILCKNDSIKMTDATIGGIWSSLFPSIATIDKEGLVIGKTTGVDSIQYTVLSKCGNITTSHPVTVLGIKPTLDTLISPASCLYPESGNIKLSINGLESPYHFNLNGIRYDNPSTIPNLTTGLYSIDIINGIGCPVDSLNIIIKEVKDGSCDTLYIPTGFLPTSSNTNGYIRMLKPYGGGSSVRQLTFRVYNRSGYLVFESHDINKGWDGTVNGIMQDVGAYVWTLEYFHNNRWMSSKGTSVLIR